MKLEIYKSGQGKYTRLLSGFGFALVVAIGCYRLYLVLSATDLNMWVKTMVPVVVFAGFGVLIFWLLNKASLADFMISAEGEVKKVNWSSRKEITVSTILVMGVLFLFAALIGITDLIFTVFFTWLI